MTVHTFFHSVPNTLQHRFFRIRRQTGSTKDDYGDATFTETYGTIVFRGVLTWSGSPGPKVKIAGEEVIYDAVIFTTATFDVYSDDILLMPVPETRAFSSSTAIATRYHVRAVRRPYRGTKADHSQIYVTQEYV